MVEKYSNDVVQKDNRNENLTSIPRKNFVIKSKRYMRRVFIHYRNKKTKKCYVDNIPIDKPGSEIISEMGKLMSDMENFLKMVKSHPPNPEDDRLLAGWINEFKSMNWIQKMSEVSLEYGIDVSDILTAEQKALELPLDALFNILWYNPLWRATTYYYWKYVALLEDQKTKLIKKKLGEEHR